MAETDWRKIVTHPAEIRIFEALEDPQWEWRTLGALSRASGLGEQEVRSILAKYPVLVRKSLLPSEKGEDLYTLQQAYFERKSLLGKSWGFLSSSSSSST